MASRSTGLARLVGETQLQRKDTRAVEQADEHLTKNAQLILQTHLSMAALRELRSNRFSVSYIEMIQRIVPIRYT